VFDSASVPVGLRECANAGERDSFIEPERIDSEDVLGSASDLSAWANAQTQGVINSLRL